MTEQRLRPEGPERISPSPGPGMPSVMGPTSYPDTPEGGVEGGPGYTPLPGGTNRTPEDFPADVTAQQGAGSGTGGLYPGGPEDTSGTVDKGFIDPGPTPGQDSPGLATPSGFEPL